MSSRKSIKFHFRCLDSTVKLSLNETLTCNFLVSRCTLRFPSTSIRLEFQSLVEESGGGASSSGAPLPPLRITIPMENDGRSPAPSPTGKDHTDPAVAYLRLVKFELAIS